MSEPLYARLEEIRQEHLRLASWNRQKDRAKRSAFHHDAALTIRDAMQALSVPVTGEAETNARTAKQAGSETQR